MTDLFFAQIREDARLERELVLQRGLRRLVVIASGGCTALSLLDDDTEEVVAVDASAAQCAAVALRAAALTRFTRDTFFGFVGEPGALDDEGEAPAVRQRLYAELAPALPAPARVHWDAHPSLVAAGLNHAGTTERFYRFLGGNLSGTVRPQEVWQELLACETLERQRTLAERHFQDEAFRLAVRVLLSRTSHLAFFPAFMFAAAAEHTFGEHFLSCFDKALRQQPMAGNYFLSQLLWGRYLLDHPAGVPPYLTKEGYLRAQRNVAKLRVVQAPLDEALGRTRSVDGFFLSNVFDWADPPGRERIAKGVVDSANPGATVLFRHMLVEPPLPASFLARLRVDKDTSAAFTARERALSYRSLVVGQVA